MNYGSPLVLCESADFDGTNDFMTTGADLTGNADAKTGLCSCWVRLDGGDGAGLPILANATTVGGSTTRFFFLRAASNVFGVIASNSSNTTILSMGSTATYTADGSTWYNVLISWDLASTTSRFIYVNDVDVTPVSPTVYTNDTIDYTVADWSAGGIPSGGNKMNGCLAELYFTNTYLDLSIVANRRRFISGSGKPVYLGATGQLPTGTQPLVYQRIADGGAASTFATNIGSGGNFSITGTLDLGSTTPSG